MNLRNLILIACASLTGLAAHAEVKYNGIEPITKNGESFRDFWDSGNFCYRQDGAVTCMGITGIVEFKLLENGKWSEDPALKTYIDSLDSKVKKAALDGYDKIYVRYITLDTSNAPDFKYLAHIFFQPKIFGIGLPSETIFEMGNVTPGAGGLSLEATGMSYSNSAEYLAAAAQSELFVPMFSVFDGSAINAGIVAQNQTLLSIGQSVVGVYLNQDVGAGSQPKR